MSHHALQHVVVRLLFDPEFVAALHAAPEVALADCGLTDVETRWLLSADPRAWNVDPLRRRRTLGALAEEFKASSALALAETRSLAFLERFFSSPNFHRAIRRRGSMGLAFAEFLADRLRDGALATPQLPDVLRLETLMARCRRDPAAAHPPPDPPAAVDDTALVAPAPQTAVGGFQANVIAVIQRVERHLFEAALVPAGAQCADAPRLDDLPPVDASRKIYLHCGPGLSGISLTAVDRAEFLVLLEAKRPASIRDLVQRAKKSNLPAPTTLNVIAEALAARRLVLCDTSPADA
jgi:hypothetical protein